MSGLLLCADSAAPFVPRADLLLIPGGRRARSALSTTGASIEQIARSTGYESNDGFCRAFERHYQLNPAEYQRRFASKENRA